MNTVPAVLFEITPSDALQNPINPFYDLYKYYIDLVIRFNIYYFAILGALVTYLAANDDANRIQPLLIVPFVLSLCQTFTYFISRKLANEIHAEKVFYLRKINSQNLAKSTTEIKNVSEKENVNVEEDANERDVANKKEVVNDKEDLNRVAYEFNPLSIILWNFAIIHLLLAIGLFIAIFTIPGPIFSILNYCNP